MAAHAESGTDRPGQDDVQIQMTRIHQSDPDSALAKVAGLIGVSMLNTTGPTGDVARGKLRSIVDCLKPHKHTDSLGNDLYPLVHVTELLRELFRESLEFDAYVHRITLEVAEGGEPQVVAKSIDALLEDPSHSRLVQGFTVPRGIRCADGEIRTCYGMLPSSPANCSLCELYACKVCGKFRNSICQFIGGAGALIDAGMNGKDAGVVYVVISTDGDKAVLRPTAHNVKGARTITAEHRRLCAIDTTREIVKGVEVEYRPNAVSMAATTMALAHASSADPARIKLVNADRLPVASHILVDADDIRRPHIAFTGDAKAPLTVVFENNYHACQVFQNKRDWREQSGPRLPAEWLLTLFGACNLPNFVILKNVLGMIVDMHNAMGSHPKLEQLAAWFLARLDGWGVSQSVETSVNLTAEEVMNTARKRGFVEIKLAWEQDIDLDISVVGILKDGTPFTIDYTNLGFCTECQQNHPVVKLCACDKKHYIGLEHDAQHGPAVELVIAGSAAALAIKRFLVGVTCYAAHRHASDVVAKVTVVDHGTGGHLNCKTVKISNAKAQEHHAWSVACGDGEADEFESSGACHRHLMDVILEGGGLIMANCAAPKVAQGELDSIAQAARQRLLHDNGWDATTVELCMPRSTDPTTSLVWVAGQNNSQRAGCPAALGRMTELHVPITCPAVVPAVFGYVDGAPGGTPGGSAQVFVCDSTAGPCRDPSNAYPMPTGATAAGAHGRAGQRFVKGPTRTFDAYVTSAGTVRVEAIYLMLPANATSCPVYFLQVARESEDPNPSTTRDSLVRHFERGMGGINIDPRHGGAGMARDRDMRHAVAANQFTVGEEKCSRVTISGLRNASHHNGKTGSIVSLSRPKVGRVGVRLDGPEGTAISVAVANVVHDAVQIPPIGFAIQNEWRITAACGFVLCGPERPPAPGLEPWHATTPGQATAFWRAAVNDASLRVTLFNKVAAIVSDDAMHAFFTNFSASVDPAVARGLADRLLFSLVQVEEVVQAVRNLLAATRPLKTREDVLAYVRAIWHEGRIPNSDVVWADHPNAAKLIAAASVHPPTKTRELAMTQSLVGQVVRGAPVGLSKRDTAIARKLARKQAAAAATIAHQARLKQAAVSAVAKNTTELRDNARANAAEVTRLRANVEELTAEVNATPSDTATDVICVVCMTAPRDVTLKPCNHVAICGGCYDLLPSPKKCPICQCHTTSAVRVYLV
jgi:hypothetical protein